MTKEQKYIIELARAAIFDEVPTEPPENLDWDNIWKKTAEQNISGLIASAIIKLSEDKQPYNAADWHRIMMETMFVMSRRYAEFERMMALMSDNGIYPICLKGVVVRELYPVPELRTMGDFDVLVDMGERKKIKEVFGNDGYTFEERTFEIDLTNNTAHWEVFSTLEQEFPTKTEYWNDKLYSSTEVDSNGIHRLNPTVELFYMVIHMAKHILGRGCGIRGLLDIVLILKHKADRIDFDEVYADVKRCGMDRVFDYMLCAADRMFGVKTSLTKDVANTDTFVEFLLNYGVFGQDVEGLGSGRFLLKDGGIIRAFFPAYPILKIEYPYLFKSKFLLPIAWMQRILRCVFVKKQTIKQVSEGLKIGAQKGQERREWLVKLGLE